MDFVDAISNEQARVLLALGFITIIASVVSDRYERALLITGATIGVLSVLLLARTS
jgi:hypothetical protein